MSPASNDCSELPPIATLLSPEERRRVDAAGQGYYRALHRENIEDVIQDLKSRRIQAVLFSVTCAGASARRVASLVREFPRVPAVALLSELEPRTPHAVLALGQCGIKRLVDVRLAAGWRELLGALMAGNGEGGHQHVLSELAVDLAGVSEDCWHFFETLFTCPPRIANVRMLAKHLDVLPSTFMSRFFRAGVPTPKRYLAMARLVRASRLFENAGFSIANVANHLDYSSPQSFGRHVRILLHMTAGEFRARYDSKEMLNRFRVELIAPYLSGLHQLHPMRAPSAWMRRQDRVFTVLPESESRFPTRGPD